MANLVGLKTSVCLDTSVIAKLFFKEKQSDLAFRLYGKLNRLDLRIIEPSFLQVEMCALIRKKESLVDPGQIKAITISEDFFSLAFDYFSVEPFLLKSSMELAKLMNLRVIYDALFLSLAMANEAFFVTADRRFLAKAKKIYQRSYSMKQALAKLK